MTPATEPPATVGFVGLGRMGRPMTARLREHGYAIVAHDADPEALTSHCAAIGAVRADGLAEVAASGLVVTMLPTSAITTQVVGEMLDPLARGALVIDMGSSAPADTVRLAARCAERGVTLVDAPVSGGVSGARSGALTVMVGGPAEAVDAAEPLLRTIGGRVVRTGQVGSAHAMKALNNLLSAVGTLASCEVLLIGRRFGLDPTTMLAVLNSSSGRTYATERKLEPFVLSESYASGFSLELMLKDVRTALDLAHQTGTLAPLGDSCAREWAAADRDLGPGADHTEIARWLERLAAAG